MRSPGCALQDAGSMLRQAGFRLRPQVRGVINTLVKVITALEGAGIELIGEYAPSSGTGRGVRLCETTSGKSAGRRQSILYDKAAAAEPM